nr:Chain C, mRNA decapping protein 2 [Saccharomyces cerevisiae]5LMF_D Chain D, mRNA decapping protein 2 [Saccharomyces cerevisiae]
TAHSNSQALLDLLKKPT